MSEHPSPPFPSACASDSFCGSGAIACDDRTADQMAAEIAAGLAGGCPTGVTVTASGNVLTIANDLGVSGVEVFSCIGMAECFGSFGYGLNFGSPINNVCNGICGDEDMTPGNSGFNFRRVPPPSIRRSDIRITKNGPPPSEGHFIQFFLTRNEHPSAPTLSDCTDDSVCDSGLILCFNRSAAGLAGAIADGLNSDPTCPPGVFDFACDNILSVVNVKSVSNVDVFCCINTFECFGLGHGLNDNCPINNVCSGFCDEDLPPGPSGFKLRKEGR